jgi:hypothetical protein
MKIPRGLYGDRDGLGDPDRFTIAERKDQSLDLLAEEYARRNSPSPFIRRLQAATDRALGLRGRR